MRKYKRSKNHLLLENAFVQLMSLFLSKSTPTHKTLGGKVLTHSIISLSATSLYVGCVFVCLIIRSENYLFIFLSTKKKIRSENSAEEPLEELTPNMSQLKPYKVQPI